MQVICVLIRNQEVIFDFVEACFRFGARLAWTQEAVFLEFPVIQNSHSLDCLFTELEDLAEHFDVQTRIAAAEDAPTALCFAHFGVTQRELLPVEALRYYSSPFRESVEISGMIRNLRKDGIRSLQELRSQLPNAIAAKFGENAKQAFARWGSKNGQAWPGFQFLENFALYSMNGEHGVLESAS